MLNISNTKESNNEVIETIKNNKDTETTWIIGRRGNMEAYSKNSARNTKYDYQPIKQGDYAEIESIADDEIFKLWNSYFISNYGRIYSAKTNKFLSPYKQDKRGYYQVDICDNGESRSERLSNLVAGLFDTDFENNRYLGQIIKWDDLHVHHIDKNKANNRADNLVILTSADHKLIHKALKAGMNLDTVEKIDTYIFIKRERRDNIDSN